MYLKRMIMLLPEEGKANIRIYIYSNRIRIEELATYNVSIGVCAIIDEIGKI